MNKSQCSHAFGIIGGTFDPVHNGHLRVAIEFAEAFLLPTVALLPCYQSPLRDKPSASNEQRLEMLSLAVQHHPQLIVDGRELEKEGLSYTIDTLTALRSQAGDDAALYFALGTDAFNHLESWKNWQSLFDVANLVVLTRPGYSIKASSAYLEEKKRVFTGEHQRSGAWYELPVTALAISATQIRQKACAQKALSFLVPEAVEQYIYQHRLYQE